MLFLIDRGSKSDKGWDYGSSRRKSIALGDSGTVGVRSG